MITSSCKYRATQCANVPWKKASRNRHATDGLSSSLTFHAPYGSWLTWSISQRFASYRATVMTKLPHYIHLVKQIVYTNRRSWFIVWNIFRKILLSQDWNNYLPIYAPRWYISKCWNIYFGCSFLDVNDTSVCSLIQKTNITNINNSCC